MKGENEDAPVRTPTRFTNRKKQGRDVFYKPNRCCRESPLNPITSPGWRQFSAELAKKNGAYPNRLYFNADEKAGAVIVFQNPSGKWAVNEAAIKYVFEAVANGRLAQGFVVLAKRPAEVVSVKKIEEATKLIGGEPPRDGDFGRYWWVDDQFSTEQSLDDAPF